ncbi:ABC transporter ATP-binding protein [Pseudoponticoccus marisrubri]|uniref:Peptide ABC transporter ATP-binding protein n=1 Tax=Pseudoponticoccus marisrubri TaxID=1685382 RepID=A0A0W7WF83_9RHOB|nr:oligopeptide/dipeptide ABC transporter ATP-binding protein [Pseudoponticoccus marisrubri]KUF09134.1 peptide ABC transporter ATP-binding protein [Pseudoponticoccus marisrubri]
MTDAPVFEVRDIRKEYALGKPGLFGGKVRSLTAVKDVSFALRRGETVGLVGESGCGKSSLARTVLRLNEPSGGEVHYHGQDILALSRPEMQKLRRHIQVVFQDPYSSLDPRFTVRRILSEPWQIFPDIVPPEQREARVAELLTLVGLNPSDADRYPHQFSGGQRQRIGIARALALEPEVIVCDEAVSALDVSVQAQVVNLLKELQDKLGLAYLFIAHDLSVVRHISDRVIVMYLGEVVEEGPVEEVFTTPRHPYTVALLSAVPLPDPSRRDREVIVLEGEVPNPIFPPSGCPFHPRCAHAQEICRQTPPPVRTIGPTRARCHFAGALDTPPDLAHAADDGPS